MRTRSPYFTLMPLLLVLLFVTNSCKEDSFPVPAASTQADFSYVADKIEDESAPFGFYFRLALTNKSVNAASYLWDFGNGQTSTDANPVVNYYQSGQFTVKLTVTSASDLYYNKLEKAVTMTFILDAVPLPFTENFNNSEDIPEFMTLIDNDGDGLGWYWGSRLGDGQARSQSYDSSTGAALTPDNFLITPKLDLTPIEAGKSVKLTYKIAPTANTAIYRQEHYGVFVSTTGKEAADFTHLLFEETITTDMTNWVLVLRELDLSQFAGQYIYVAFRHYNVTDMDRIVLDDIEIFEVQK